MILQDYAMILIASAEHHLLFDIRVFIVPCASVMKHKCFFIQGSKSRCNVSSHFQLISSHNVTCLHVCRHFMRMLDLARSIADYNICCLSYCMIAPLASMTVPRHMLRHTLHIHIIPPYYQHNKRCHGWREVSLKFFICKCRCLSWLGQQYASNNLKYISWFVLKRNCQVMFSAQRVGVIRQFFLLSLAEF